MEVQSLVKLINCRKGRYNNEKFIATVIKMTVAVVGLDFPSLFQNPGNC